MTPIRPVSAIVLLSLATVLAASCGLPEQDEAQMIGDLPDDLLAVTTTSTPVPAAIEDDAPFELVLYWHESDQGPLIRIVRPRTTQPTPQDALLELIDRPTPEEIEKTVGVGLFGPNAGLTDPELAPVIQGPENGIVTVLVQGTGFRDLPNKANAAEELVCTLTEFDDIEGVVVRDAQPDPIGLVGRNSESIEGPATRANFDDCMTAELPPVVDPDASSTTTG